MNILDRIRVALMRREVASLRAVDRAERNQVRTTINMMLHMVERTTRIVELENRIREIEGTNDESDIADSQFDSRLPSKFGVPTKGEANRLKQENKQ